MYPRHARYRKLSRLAGNSKLLAFLASLVTKFTGTATGKTVSATVASNGLTVTAHGLAVGDGPFRFSAVTGTLSGVSTTTDYYVRSVVDANTITLAATPDVGAAALAVSAGAGTATLTRTVTNASVARAINRKGLAAVKAATDIDNV